MPRLKMTFSKIVLSILGYKESEEWVALAIEMDLRGYGRTFKEALEDLQDLVRMQIGFALFKREPEMIWKPAEPKYLELFAQLKSETLREMAAESPVQDRGGEFRMGGLALSPPDLSAARGSWFTLAHA